MPSYASSCQSFDELLAGAAGGGSVAAGGGAPGPGVFMEEDEEEGLLAKIGNHPTVVYLNDAVDRLFLSNAFNIMFDVLSVLLFALDIFTDVRVIRSLAGSEDTLWMALMICIMITHFVVLAVLVCAYLRRASRWSILGISSEHVRHHYLWVLFVPVAVPGVLVLDMCLLGTTLLPMLFKHSLWLASISAFLSNYNFSRLFISFVFESLPMTVLQTYIYWTVKDDPIKSGSHSQKQVIALSLTLSAVNVIKYSYQLWKAADDAGLRVHEYFKYVLLLKGNYDVPPGTLAAVIDESCSLSRDGLFTMNGFLLHRDKNNCGVVTGTAAMLTRVRGRDTAGGQTLPLPACRLCPLGRIAVTAPSDAHTHTRPRTVYLLCCGPSFLLRSREASTCLRPPNPANPPGRLLVSGCPLASINRILQRGIQTFRHMNSLEVNECALRGDTWRVVTRAIKRHKHLEKVKIIQTGVLKKYRNNKLESIPSIFKHNLGLKQVALCLHWWNEEHMMRAAELLRDHPTLESLAIEFPSAVRAANEMDVVGGLGLGAADFRNPLSDGGPGSGRPLPLPSMQPSSPYVGLELPSTVVGADNAGAAFAVPLSAQYGWVVAGVMHSAPVLRALYLHNHALSAEGFSAVAKALSNNTRLAVLSLRGSAVGDGGAAALAGKRPQLLALSLVLALATQARAANPTNGVVTAGQAGISRSGANTTITQSSANVVINWQSFGIDAGSTVQFLQPGRSSVALNRVLGADPSIILGNLKANGNVFIVNPNGVLFGSSASVNVGGLVASTLALSDANFLAGHYAFDGAGTGSIVNDGAISAAEGGCVALLGRNVSNQGVISARLGSVATGDLRSHCARTMNV
ncbi:MAG: hypothetical protein WDW38_000018 [Sanguina aurantia]